MSIYTIEHGYRKSGNKLRRGALVMVTGVIGISSYLIYQYEPPKPAANISAPAAAIAEPPKLTTAMPWPSYGQSAYGVLDEGVLATSDDTAEAVPVASLAKVITALAILKEKPLQPGEQGPMITLDEQDVALYGKYISKNGVVVPVEVGEQISQYQAMQAMLLTSANNMSDTLARWAFGSVESYTVYANTMVKELGLSKTSVADASGFSPGSASTAHDMVRLGALYMKHPVLREIALQQEAVIPVAGTIPNYNSLVNEDGIIGIKVGDTDEAGRCFLVADIRKTEGSEDAISVVAVVGAENLVTAMQDARTILDAGNAGYDKITTE